MIPVLFLLAQTLVSPLQLVSANQVRIGPTDMRPGTLLATDQLSDGRHVRRLSDVDWMRMWWPAGTPDATRIVCTRSVVGVVYPAGVQTNYLTEFCFSAGAQQDFLSDAANAAWYNQQP